jgi:hypothetical protein
MNSRGDCAILLDSMYTGSRVLMRGDIRDEIRTLGMLIAKMERGRTDIGVEGSTDSRVSLGGSAES